jgi:hypothetical protein
MQARPRTPEETYGPALGRAESTFAELGPDAVAFRADVAFKPLEGGEGLFRVPFLGTQYDILWPTAHIVLTGRETEADIATRILLLHYLIHADGTPLASHWIAFRNLPGGLGYDAAFQKRASQRLAHKFGRDRTAFDKAARRLGAERLAFGDAAFLFRALPRVWLAVILYLADEEFPPGANVLFDAAASHYLPTEDLAVLGGMLTSQIIKAV